MNYIGEKMVSLIAQLKAKQWSNMNINVVKLLLLMSFE